MGIWEQDSVSVSVLTDPQKDQQVLKKKTTTYLSHFKFTKQEKNYKNCTIVSFCYCTNSFFLYQNCSIICNSAWYARYFFSLLKAKFEFEIENKEMTSVIIRYLRTAEFEANLTAESYR